MGGAPNRLMPAKHGLFIKSPKGLKLRDRSVQRIVRQVRELCDWIKPCDVPLLRRWAELEIHALRIHAFLKLVGDVNQAGDPRSLLDAHRKIALAQASIGAQLGLSPASRRQLQASGEYNDIAAQFASRDDEPTDAEVVALPATETRLGATEDPDSTSNHG
jgi:hypothetical protein